MSPDRVVATGTRHDKRPKHSVLCDARLTQLLEEDSGIRSVEDALKRGSLVEELRDDRIYLVEADLYHTLANVDQSNAYKINEGPEGKGLAGDIDVGYLDLYSLEFRNIELKSNRNVSPVHSLDEEDKTPSCVKRARETNCYISNLLNNFEGNTGIHVPYNPSVEVWNGVMESGSMESSPRFSDYGSIIASQEAIETAQNSLTIKEVDDGLFNSWLFGGDEIIREEDLSDDY